MPAEHRNRKRGGFDTHTIELLWRKTLRVRILKGGVV